MVVNSFDERHPTGALRQTQDTGQKDHRFYMTILRIDERVGVAGKSGCRCFIRRIAAWVRGAE
jgi:hypothetical protein